MTDVPPQQSQPTVQNASEQQRTPRQSRRSKFLMEAMERDKQESIRLQEVQAEIDRLRMSKSCCIVTTTSAPQVDEQEQERLRLKREDIWKEEQHRASKVQAELERQKVKDSILREKAKQ